MAKKVLAMSKPKALDVPAARQPHVIQFQRLRDSTWRDVPGLIYGSKKSARDGLRRLLAAAPEHKLRVWPWQPPPTVSKRRLLAA
jgi:hypothetical protein